MTMTTKTQSAIPAALIALLLCLGALRLLMACNSFKEHARDIAETIIDCTVENSTEITAEFGPLVDAALRAATRPDGSIDWAPLEAASKRFTAKAGGCVLAAAVAKALAPAAPVDPAAPQSSPLEVDRVALRAGFDRIRAAQFGGARFKTAEGLL